MSAGAYAALIDDELLLDDGPCLEILNAGAGHLKVSFAKGDPVERERARRLVTDMLKAGYAIFVEVKGQLRPVRKFDPKTDEYLIDQVGALPEALPEKLEERLRAEEALANLKAPSNCTCGRPLHHRGRCKGKKVGPYARVPMTSTRATAVGRTAGG